MSLETITTAQTIADLNTAHDPSELSHYFMPESVERSFFNGGRPIAFCGYRLRRRSDVADVTSTSRGEYVPEDVELCPACHVLRQHGQGGTAQ